MRGSEPLGPAAGRFSNRAGALIAVAAVCVVLVSVAASRARLGFGRIGDVVIGLAALLTGRVPPIVVVGLAALAGQLGVGTT